MSINTVNVSIPLCEASQYPIFIGQGLLGKVGSYVKKYLKAEKILIVTSKNVEKLYGNVVKESLNSENLKVDFVVLEDGEQFKNFESLESIWDKALSIKLERKDAILALGGGVIGDIAGFAASSYLRGIDFIQIPTTLLAQVDSSVGGKVAINNKFGKNLIGAFYQPKLVIADTETLNTLPLEQLKTGLAEVVKYGFIERSCGAKTSFPVDFAQYLNLNKENIFALFPETVTQVVKYCCELKAVVVNQDEKETGLRAILNFGHTIGHSIEKCTAYTAFTHGQAVAIGMKGALFIAHEQKLINESYFDFGINLIKSYDLDYKIPQNVLMEDLTNAMFLDKKVVSNQIRFILPNSPATVDIYNNIDQNIIKEALATLY